MRELSFGLSLEELLLYLLSIDEGQLPREFVLPFGNKACQERVYLSFLITAAQLVETSRHP